MGFRASKETRSRADSPPSLSKGSAVSVPGKHNVDSYRDCIAKWVSGKCYFIRHAMFSRGSVVLTGQYQKKEKKDLMESGFKRPDYGMYEADCHYWNPVPAKNRITSEDRAKKTRVSGRTKKTVLRPAGQPVTPPARNNDMLKHLSSAASESLEIGMKALGGLYGAGWILKKSGDLLNVFGGAA